MGSIPPNANHPLYNAWFAASVRVLMAREKLNHLTQLDPDFAATRSELEAANTAYNAILEKL